MGQRLEKIYDIITQKAGLEARMKFSERTGVPRKKAEKVPDSEELVQKFKKIASEILGQNIDDLM